jgi:hypothetical protein
MYDYIGRDLAALGSEVVKCMVTLVETSLPLGSEVVKCMVTSSDISLPLGSWIYVWY